MKNTVSVKRTQKKNSYEVFNLVKKGLKIGSLNVCHLIPKLDEIKLSLQHPNGLPVFGMCETFLNSKTTNTLLKSDGFNIERKDRNRRNGSGILVYIIRNNLSCMRRLHLESDDIKTVWIEFKLPYSKPLLTCFVYRPSSSLISWIDKFEEKIILASQQNSELITLGDLNINFTPK